MRVLIACEFSGIVRDEFRALGHDAMSCDLDDTEQLGPHWRGDVRAVLGWGWDLMIAHPPCTHLSASGARYWAAKQADGRQQAAIAFVLELANAPIDLICIENPVGILSSAWRRPDQIIQPWQFGEDASKATCLWLKNLPLLRPTNIIQKARYASQTPSGQNRLGSSDPERAKNRSRTYRGIAAAMAAQWGSLRP
ncbi:MAG: DNA cytosine methyltransferase [Planctomycetaceae bacterium]|nr:MAG: DNA cytosine methyltransferase [Planctomycetaceae bacterium]